MDAREPLIEGESLILGGRAYHIQGLIGRGATSFVYSARYTDSLRGHKSHSVLIKELFPYHPKGMITRGERGEIIFPPEMESFFALRKKSFIRGNDAHIDLQNSRADMAGVNIDSYQEYGSIYTVLGNLHGETLQDALNGGGIRITLPTVLHWLHGLLDALEVFHRRRLLHLDISPDNILLLPLDDGKPERKRRLLLVDYNSVWDMDELSQSGDAYFSVKDGYSAPEVRLKEQRSICAASDLFSVCAVFFELLQGSRLDFSALYTGGRIMDTDAGLLKDAAPNVKAKILEILRQGLRLPPKRRFQTIGELRRELAELENLVFGEDVLARATGLFKRRASLIMAATLLLAFALSFAAIKINESLRGYPITTREKYVTDNAMTALAASLGKLGGQIENDMAALNAYGGGYDAFLQKARDNEAANDALTLSRRYDEKAMSTFKEGASPMRFDLLLGLLNAPDDYRAWSDEMLIVLQSVLPDEKYPEQDRAAIAGLYADYIDAYADLCYAKTRLVVLPLNEDGRKALLGSLPYVSVFGEKFLLQRFGENRTELEAALNAAKNTLSALSTEIKCYGVEMEWLN